MKRIGLISDTHGFLDQKVFDHFANCDEIWHAGDFGNGVIADQLKKFRPLKGVFGNIDGQDIRGTYPESLKWECEDIRVYMTHIGGYPPKYTPDIRQHLLLVKPQLFISGHSHILRIMYDNNINCLHMNPGAAGNHGWHKVKTIVRFAINGAEIKDCEVIELGLRGKS